MTIDHALTSLAAIGINPPAPVRPWLEVRDRLAAEMDNEPISDHRLVVDDLLEGDTAAIVASVTRARVEAATRRTTIIEMREAASQRALAALRRESDSILRTARKSFEKTAASLAPHVDAFKPDDDTAKVLRQGPAAAAAWAAFEQAGATLDAHITAWSALYGRRSIDVVIKSYDGDWWRRVDAEALYDTPNRWHALMAAGYELTLNSPDEITALRTATPERELRVEQVRNEGFGGARMVRG